MELVFFLQKLVHFFDQRLILFECNLIFNLRLKGEELLLLGLMDAFCDRPLLSFLVRVLATDGAGGRGENEVNSGEPTDTACVSYVLLSPGF